MSGPALLTRAVPVRDEGRVICVEGRVQGVGFRPFVRRLALQHDLTGWVRNQAGRVEIQVSGRAESLEIFTRELIASAPPLARPRITQASMADVGTECGFSIRASEPGPAFEAELPPDLFVCDDCLAEMSDPTARRYRYPFINCTQCGPRYTIIRALPYDRPCTTMAAFDLCPQCRAEYGDPADRRYHAQPLACPACGPSLWFRDASGLNVSGDTDALEVAAQALRAGHTIAVKGIGGYHLICDATRPLAVQQLRARKRRPAKPLAVMLPMPAGESLGWAHRVSFLDPLEAAALTDPIRPIVLVRCRASAELARDVAPGLAEVGLMLPYSPLHHLLLQRFARPVIATSANLSGEPVLTDPDEVEARLAACCDGFLHHDRPIERPADDPVVRVVAGRVRTVRLGRGMAPLALALPAPLARATLACGGQMRTTVALGDGCRAVVSPHLGDMGSPRATRVFSQVAEGLQRLYGLPAERIACDAHPGYSTRAWARDSGRPVQIVHHHAAHASALVGEHGLTEPVVVFTWDGIGLGVDGGWWGGEALYGRPGGWQRLGRFRPLRLIGGDAVAAQPWRSAAAVCWELGVALPFDLPGLALVRHAWDRHVNAHLSGAVGRLFDAAAALLGLIETASYDGQAPAMLEARTRGRGERIPLPIVDEEGGVWKVDWEPLMRALLMPGTTPTNRAEAFHSSLAFSILTQARKALALTGVRHVGLTGGVFQNRRLTEEAVDLLEADGFDVRLAEKVPPNDGGLSYGQLVECAAMDRREQGGDDRR